MFFPREEHKESLKELLCESKTRLRDRLPAYSECTLTHPHYLFLV